MADISKIKTLDGTTYNIKDATARSSIPAAATSNPVMDGTAAVGSSTKYAKEDHRHPSDTTKLNKSAELLTTNPFAPESLKGPYISKIDNAFYAADKRWNVSITNASNSARMLFDGDYESNVVISNGATSVLTMDFSTEPNGCFPGYPYGYILVSFYYRSAPASVSGRVYCNYEPHGIGWHDITFSPMPDNQTAAIAYRGYQGTYNISKLEITIVGDTTNPDGNTKPTQVEMHLDRPYAGRNPFLSKYAAETLYYSLTAPSFVGSLTGNATSANSATKATQDESGNNIKASYAASMSISGSTITLKNKNGSSLGTVTVPGGQTYTAVTSKMVTTTVPNITSVGSAPTLGTAIPADDITAWNAGSTPTLGTAIPADDITAWDAGSTPTLGTAIPADDITAWTSNTPTSASVVSGVFKITNGSAASLSYTAKSIPNVTSVGSVPSLSYTAKSIPNVTSVGSVPSLSYTAKSIPNVTSVGSAPTLGTAITVATGSLAADGSGATVATGITAS